MAVVYLLEYKPVHRERRSTPTYHALEATDDVPVATQGAIAPVDDTADTDVARVAKFTRLE